MYSNKLLSLLKLFLLCSNRLSNFLHEVRLLGLNEYTEGVRKVSNSLLLFVRETLDVG